MQTMGQTTVSGQLQPQVYRSLGKAPLWWRLRQRLNRGYIKGWLQFYGAILVSQFLRITTFRQELNALGFHFVNENDRMMWEAYSRRLAQAEEEGNFEEIAQFSALVEQMLSRRQAVDYGVLSHRAITDTGVAFLVDDWDDNTTDITNMNYHASGTDNTAENQTDTALGAEATTVTDRVAGTKSQPSANQLRSIGTQNFTGTAAIVEHGLFSVITESAGVLWDRSVFTVINVGNGDSIQWTYTCTVTAGG